MLEQDGAYKENHERLKEVAMAKGLIFNPDKDRKNKVIGLMTRNFKEFGKYFCPCKQQHPLNPDVDPLCPCNEMDKEIAKDGHCYCKLFFKGGD